MPENDKNKKSTAIPIFQKQKSKEKREIFESKKQKFAL